MTTGEQTGCPAVPVVPSSAPHLHLAIQNGPQRGTRIPCRRVVTLIGSRNGCRLRLPHDRVAPVHAAIINNGQKILAVDLLSPNRTLLNGLKMELEKLSDGDKLEIGPWDFAVEISSPPRNGSHNGEVVDLDPSPTAVAFEHLDTGRVLQPNREACLIGRRNGCDIVIADPDISRVHALLLTYGNRPAIVDLLSRNGTLVNDEPVHFKTLEDQDQVRIGESVFRVRVLGSNVAENVGKRTAAKPAAPPPDTDTDEELIELEAADSGPDLVDIAAVDSAQKWRIADDADKLEKSSRR